VAFISSFETPINADGSFQFSKLPQGSYAASLTGDNEGGWLTPAAVLVTGQDLFGIELTLQPRKVRPESRDALQPLSGATVTELGFSASGADGESGAVANLRTVNTAQVTYLSASMGKYGTMQNLVEVGLLDKSFLSVKDGYSFHILADGSEYIATAVPSGGGSRFGYYSTPDAVVRYSLAEQLSPAQAGGQAVR
jgi:hypothetical protein